MAWDFGGQGPAVFSMQPRPLSTRALLEYQVGNIDQGEAYLERYLETEGLIAPGPSVEYGFARLIRSLV